MGDLKVQTAAAEERVAQAVKRADEADAKAAKAALEVKEIGNKCDALKRRLAKAEDKVQIGKEELRRSKATAEGLEERVSELVVELKQAHNKCEVSEELRISQA